MKNYQIKFLATLLRLILIFRRKARKLVELSKITTRNEELKVTKKCARTRRRIDNSRRRASRFFFACVLADRLVAVRRFSLLDFYLLGVAVDEESPGYPCCSCTHNSRRFCRRGPGLTSSGAARGRCCVATSLRNVHAD